MMISIKRLIIAIGIATIVATLATSQLRLSGPSWDGVVQRGKVRVRAGGSVWSVNGMPVAHTQEFYESQDTALYILDRLNGKMRTPSELASKAGSVQFKVTRRKGSTRIAWVCKTDLHYVDAKSYSAALAFLAVWEFGNC